MSLAVCACWTVRRPVLPEASTPDAGSASRATGDPVQYEAKLARAAFVAMPIAAFLLHADGRIVLHTRRAGRVYHHTAVQPGTGLEGIDFSELTHLDTDGLRQVLRASVSSGQVTLPMNDAHRGGKAKDVAFHLSLMRIEGVRDQLFMLSQDHLRASATALQNANLMRAQESDRGLHLQAHINTLQSSVLSMETFANAASHDLKTPINALSGLLDLFRSTFGPDLPAEAQPYLDHMQNAVARMDVLTSKLLAHAQSSTAPMELHKVSLAETIRSVIDQLEPDLRATAQEIAVNGPDFDVMAEPTMLQILLGNVIGNALKHRQADQPLHVTLQIREDGPGALLTIADTGTGFDPSQAKTIFEPFVRLKPDIQGSGMGLATCAEICQRHKWDIAATSDGQSGATFTIRFPAVLRL